MGKTARRSSIGNWMEKSTAVGMSICSLAGKEAEYGSHVEEIDEKRGS